MEKEEKLGKAPYDEPEKSAQGILGRLNDHYDASRVESEKNAMKNLDDVEDTDAEAPREAIYSAVNTTPTEEIRIGRKELRKLYDKYLNAGSEIEEPVAEPIAEPVEAEEPIAEVAEIEEPVVEVTEPIVEATEPHEELAEIEEASEKTDVEKNIDEAEKYIDAIITGDAPSAKNPDAAVPTAETLVYDAAHTATENISAYEPETVRIEHGRVKRSAPRSQEKASGYTDELDAPTDTAMMKAFGLDPKNEITDETERVFSKFSFSDSYELASTEEISARELEGEIAPPISVSESERTGFEYTDPAQNKPIFSNFRVKYVFSKIKMVFAAMIAVMLLLLENFSQVTTYFADSPDLFVAVDWVLFFVAAALVADRLIYAARMAVRLKFTPEAITLVTFIYSIVVTVVTSVGIFSNSVYDVPRMYNFGFAVCVFLSCVACFISLRRDVYSFKIASSRKVKKVLTHIVATEARTPETTEFSEYLGAESEVTAIRKTNFVSDFFARRRAYPKSMAVLNIMIPLCLVVSVCVFFVCRFGVLLNSTESIGFAYASFLMGVPFAAFVSYSYPIYLASRRAYTYNSALVGDETPEDYANTSVVVFRDEDAFPAGKIKVSGIRIYGDRNIANAVYYASGVYSKLGGPLATVFKGATLNSIVPEDVEIREIANEGVCAVIDGKSIVMGRPSYMENQCFETLPDEGDENYEGSTNHRILYLACEQIIIAKFYIEYHTTSDFLYNLRHLTNSGICTSIRTADPCIDEEILYDNKMNPRKYPIKIIKGMVAEEKADIISAGKGGVVSVGSVKDTVKTLMLCEKLGNVRRTTLALKVVASLLGFAVMALLLVAQNDGSDVVSKFLSVYPAIFQCFWLLPTIFVSKIYI